MSEHPRLQDIRQDRMSAFVEMLGLKLIHLDQDGCSMRLETRPEHLNTSGRVHGGVTFSMLDTAMGAAVFAYLNADETTATIESKINYMQGITRGVVDCQARVVHLGSRTAVVEGEVWQNGVLAAKCLGTFARI